jgi:3-polyprenyl-4-hydroxybenzoate decarboxylase
MVTIASTRCVEVKLTIACSLFQHLPDHELRTPTQCGGFQSTRDTESKALYIYIYVLNKTECTKNAPNLALSMHDMSMMKLIAVFNGSVGLYAEDSVVWRKKRRFDKAHNVEASVTFRGRPVHHCTKLPLSRTYNLQSRMSV